MSDKDNQAAMKALINQAIADGYEARFVVEDGTLVLQLTKTVLTVSPDVTVSVTYIQSDDAPDA